MFGKNGNRLTHKTLIVIKKNVILNSFMNLYFEPFIVLIPEQSLKD